MVYLDDTTIISKNHDPHLQDIDNVLSTLYAVGILLKLKKCYWLTTVVKYLVLEPRFSKLRQMENSNPLGSNYEPNLCSKVAIPYRRKNFLPLYGHW